MAYVDLTTRFVYELQTVFGDFSKLANNDAFIKDNGWQDGTVGVFFQATAPTGWTKLTTVDARALRIVSGIGGGVGGANDPASILSLAHTHSVGTQADHTHTINSHTHHLATSGTDKNTGAASVFIGTSGANNTLRSGEGAGSDTLVGKLNQMPLTGASYSTGAAGSHSHTGLTDSQLSSISFAYANVIYASKDTSTGYTNLTATFVHNTRHVFDYLSQLAANDAYNYARRTPAGTVSLFGSATAPTGWTKLTTANGKLLRIVSGATGGSTGGTDDPSTPLSLAHTHSISSDGSHSHSSPAHQHLMDDTASHSPLSLKNYLRTPVAQLRETDGIGGINATTFQAITALDGSGTTSTDGAHVHTTGSSLGTISLAYLDVIQASKDSAGAATVYTDYTSFFVDQDLLAYQDLQVMANNDAYLYYHTMPSAAVSFFFQASAPLNWTKVTTQNDCLIRVVSGATGGTAGGTAALSTVSLAHTHSISVASHSHSFAHTHNLNTESIVFNGTLTNNRIFGANGSALYRDAIGAGSDTSLGTVTDSQTLSTSTDDHSHGGATGSALSDLSLAYADVIQCSKN